VLGLLLAMAPGVRADSVSYSFTRIATTDGPSVFFHFPSLNNGGAVAFETVTAGGANIIILTGSGGALTTIADRSSLAGV